MMPPGRRQDAGGCVKQEADFQYLERPARFFRETADLTALEIDLKLLHYRAFLTESVL